jgi:hypothetical protein
MNTFYEHHKDSIRFQYACFDRILLNATIPLLLEPTAAQGFFSYHRHMYPVTRKLLHDISERYHQWVENQARQWKVPILEDPEGRREDIVAPYFTHAKADRMVAIIKAREPAHILVSIGGRESRGCHLERNRRWVMQYNFYLKDRELGPMFIRMCPYFPFPARVCLNQHHWIAEQLDKRGVRFQKSDNSFSGCADPEILQRIADSFSPGHLIMRASKWLAYLMPFFTKEERNEHGCHHRLFIAQVEYCHNLIFRRRAVLDALQEKLLDLNRSIGQPNKLTLLFGRRINRCYRGQLQTTIEDLNLGSPVIRSHYKSSSVKQYVRDHKTLRTEPASNDVTDLGMKKAVEHLPELRGRLQQVVDNYLNVQQDILETFLNRGEMERLSQPTLLDNGKRIPGLKTNHPRQLALMHALVRFSHLAGGGIFTTTQLLPHVVETLACTISPYNIGSLRYDLSKLRAKGLVEKLPHSRRYRLTRDGYRLCVIYLKLFERFYAPLAAAIVQPFHADANFPIEKISALDKLYMSVTKALDQLADHVGLGVAA